MTALDNVPSGPPIDRLLVKIPVAAEMLSLSRASFYRLMDKGLIPSVGVGRARRVTMEDLKAFVEHLKKS